jgi:hypothetical protein
MFNQLNFTTMAKVTIKRSADPNEVKVFAKSIPAKGSRLIFVTKSADVITANGWLQAIAAIEVKGNAYKVRALSISAFNIESATAINNSFQPQRVKHDATNDICAFETFEEFQSIECRVADVVDHYALECKSSNGKASKFTTLGCEWSDKVAEIVTNKDNSFVVKFGNISVPSSEIDDAMSKAVERLQNR